LFRDIRSGLLRATFWATVMPNPSAHRTRRSYHRVIAVILMTMYMIIVTRPLAPFAMHAEVAAHAVSGECSGDCDICGCSPESRANQTCCCAKKRQQQAHVHEDDGDETADCCKKKPVEKKTILACGCPCGNGKQFPLSSAGISEVILCNFTEQFSPHHTDTRFPTLAQHPTSRHGEPPDPPPKLV